jgi:hypothetical protein
MKRLRWLAASLIPLICGGAEIPEPVLPAGVGVNIHFVTGHQQDLDLIHAAGFKFIRMDFGWGSIERRKGEYNWSEYDELLKNLGARGIRPVFILDYSHGLYEETVTNENPLTHQMHRNVAAPQHPESVAAFARWAAASARHYQGRHVIWEIWNEPNIQFWSPKPNAEQYSTLALATAKAVREAEPSATIVGPASSTFPWDFLETLFKSGVLEYLDAVSVHPYRNPHRPPETAAADYQKLRELIDRYASGARRGKIPILSGEWGYSSWTKGVSLEAQAAFAARQQLSNLLNGVPLSIWYDWKNDGSDPNENEHNFGTVLPDLQPKPAYVAIRTLTSELSGSRIVRRLPLGDQDYALLLQNAAGQQKLAAWTLSPAHAVNIRLSSPAGNPAGMRGNGESFVPKMYGGQLVLDLTAEPQYVGLGTATVIGD